MSIFHQLITILSTNVGCALELMHTDLMAVLTPIHQNILDVLKIYIMNNINFADKQMNMVVMALLTTSLSIMKYDNIVAGYKKYKKSLYIKQLKVAYSENNVVFHPIKIEFNDKFFHSYYDFNTVKDFLVIAPSHMSLPININMVISYVVKMYKLKTNNPTQNVRYPIGVMNNTIVYFVVNSTKGNQICIADTGVVSENDAMLEKGTQIIPPFLRNWVETNKCMLSFGSETKSRVLNVYSTDTKEVIPLIGKSFDSIVSTEAERIERLIDMFESKELIKKFNGYGPKNLGIMLHGPPGTGKSSMFAAIAEKTKRNLLMVNMKTIKNTDEFISIMNGRWKHPTEGTLCTINNTIFCFEEIDCVPAVLDRANITASVDEVDNTQQKAHLDMKKQALCNLASKSTTIDDVKKINEELDRLHETIDDASKSKLSLSVILTELSGVANVSNRIVIATTNHPNILDPALIRPGRFDILAKLTYVDNYSANKLLQKIFKYSIPADFGNQIDVKDLKISPALFINLCINFGDYESVTQFINKSSQAEVNSIR
jgi:ATP-dependent 26S proteasome regulatory subunit